LLESLLAYAHFVAILSVVVFITSEAALCRAEWLNAAVVRRLARVDVIYLVAAVAVLANPKTAPKLLQTLGMPADAATQPGYSQRVAAQLAGLPDAPGVYLF